MRLLVCGTSSVPVHDGDCLVHHTLRIAAGRLCQFRRSREDDAKRKKSNGHRAEEKHHYQEGTRA